MNPTQDPLIAVVTQEPLLGRWDWQILIVTFIFAVALFVLAVWRLREAMVFWRLPTRSIRSLREGPSEVRGTLACDRPLTSGLGTPCAAILSRSWRSEGNGRHKRWVLHHESYRCAQATLSDPTGMCALDLSRTTVLGEVWKRVSIDEREMEVILPVGATVLVCGDAHPTPQTSGSTGPAGPRFTLGPSESVPLAVSTSGHPMTLWRAAWPSVIRLVCAVVLVLLGSSFVWDLQRLAPAFRSGP